LYRQGQRARHEKSWNPRVAPTTIRPRQIRFGSPHTKQSNYRETVENPCRKNKKIGQLLERAGQGERAGGRRVKEQRAAGSRDREHGEQVEEQSSQDSADQRLRISRQREPQADDSVEHGQRGERRPQPGPSPAPAHAGEPATEHRQRVIAAADPGAASRPSGNLRDTLTRGRGGDPGAAS